MDLKRRIKVKALHFSKSLFRLVLHWNITEADAQAAVDKCLYVINEMK